eukprot:COSAG01_NODE_7544_length_3157_cov_12.331916_1_plen_390_part_00
MATIGAATARQQAAAEGVAWVRPACRGVAGGRDAAVSLAQQYEGLAVERGCTREADEASAGEEESAGVLGPPNARKRPAKTWSSADPCEQAREWVAANPDWAQQKCAAAGSSQCGLTKGLYHVLILPGRQACAAWLNSAGFQCDTTGEQFTCIQKASSGLEDLITMMEEYAAVLEDHQDDDEDAAEELKEELEDTDLVFFMTEELDIAGAADQQRLRKELEGIIEPYRKEVEKEAHCTELYEIFSKGDGDQVLKELSSLLKKLQAPCAEQSRSRLYEWKTPERNKEGHHAGYTLLHGVLMGPHLSVTPQTPHELLKADESLKARYRARIQLAQNIIRAAAQLPREYWLERSEEGNARPLCVATLLCMTRASPGRTVARMGEGVRAQPTR